MENYQEETSKLGRFLLCRLNRILGQAGQCDKILRVGDDEFDQIARVRNFCQNDPAGLFAKTELSRPRTELKVKAYSRRELRGT